MAAVNVIKLTPEMLQRLCYAIMQGATRDLACKYAKVNSETLNGWLNVGKLTLSGVTPKQITANGKTHPELAAERYSPDILSDCQELYLAIIEAEGIAVIKWLEKIEEASEKDWKAAAWKLERLYPEIFGKQLKVKQDITSNGEAISNLVNTALIKVYGNSDDNGAGSIIESSQRLRLPEKSDG